MKKFSEQLYKKSLSVKLQAAERRELRERVVSYMEYHPLPTAATNKMIASPFAEKFVTIPFSYITRAGVFAALFMLVAVPVLAERAVPGDGLYAVKVRFNEELRSTLALSQYEKIEWETERLNRRIAEARLLASEGRLTEEVEAEVAAAVKNHTENAKREIEELRSEDEEEATLASIALTTTLEVQAASLKEKNKETKESTDQQPTLLAAAVEEVAAQESAVPVGVPGYEKLMARVEANTTRIYELFETLNLGEDSEYYQDIQRRLSDINRTVETAAGLREADEDEARLQLVDALQRTQKLIVFMTEIQASQEFTVEEFVPVVLTPEETQVKLDTYQKETSAIIGQVRSARASTTDKTAALKADAALARLSQLQLQLTATATPSMLNTTYEEIAELGADTLLLFRVLNTAVGAEPTLEPNRATSSETEETTT